MRTRLWWRRLARPALAIAMMCLIMLGYAADIAPALASATSSDISKQKSTLDTIKNKIEQTRKSLTKVKKEETNALGALQKVEERLENLKTQISKTEAKRRVAEQQLAEADADLKAAQKALAVAEEAYGKSVDSIETRLTEIYKLGPGTYLELLLGADDFADFVTRYEYLGMVVQQDFDTLSRVRSEKEALEEQRKDIARRQAGLEERQKEIALLSASLKEEEKSVQAATQDKARYLKQIQAERAKWEKELAEEERQSRELEQTIRDMQARLAASGQQPKWTGKFVWPTEGRISSSYGWRIHPIFGDRRFHSGIDIAAAKGTKVKAAADGVVLLAASISGYGNTVILDHGGGLSTLYGHNSSLTTSTGRAVLQGDIIAKVGSTGFATGPHLHFEVRQGGTTQDPMSWLPPR